MFDPHPVTPERTSWTMALLNRLDKVLGSAVMDRPVFTLSEVSPPGKPEPSPLLKDLENENSMDFSIGVPTDPLSYSVKRRFLFW
ncbi:MAG: hypothetical protein JWO80_629 [Bryobacterales bacterium]|nr:hypothetical protein [Bryobacterales bacterium]